MKLSADESDLLCLRRPVQKVSSMFSPHSQALTKYDFATIKHTYDLISRGSVQFYL